MCKEELIKKSKFYCPIELNLKTKCDKDNKCTINEMKECWKPILDSTY